MIILNIFDLLFLSVTSGRVTVASLVSAIATPIAIIIMVIVLFFKVGDEFVKLFLTSNKK